MFRLWKKQDNQDILVAQPVDAAEPVEAAEPIDDAEPVDTIEVEPATFESLPYIDNETLEEFLADQDSVELLPVDPSEYRRELQRLIVSAFLHEASIQAKQVEAA
ncbi:MAG: hypothetical protein WD207_03965 [Xanthobacteraceae bacterium]